MAFNWLELAGLGTGILSSLFGEKKNSAQEQEDILNKRQPLTIDLWEPTKNPGLRTQMQLGPSNQFNWEALAPLMTDKMAAMLEAAAPQYSGYTTPENWGQPGTGTGGATGSGNNQTIEGMMGYNPFRPWQNPALGLR